MYYVSIYRAVSFATDAAVAVEDRTTGVDALPALAHCHGSLASHKVCVLIPILIHPPTPLPSHHTRTLLKAELGVLAWELDCL